MKRNLCRRVLFACSALAALGSISVARADQFLIAHDTTSSAVPVMYVKSNSGSCRKVSIPFVTDGAGVRHYLATGTAGDDIMLVYDTGAPSVNWCGFTGIRPLAAPPNRGVIHVAGGLGSDTIWGGNGGGAVVIASIWGSDMEVSNDNNSVNYIWAGTSINTFGGEGGNWFFLPEANDGYVAGGSKGDVFCTAVSNVFSNPNFGEISAQKGSDSRFGPAAEIESNLETKGPVNDACNLTYIAVYQKVLGMLAN